MLGKTPDLSQTRGPTPMPTQQSIHCVPELDRTLRSCSAQRSVQVRSKSRERLEVEVGCQSTFSAGACSPMMDWMMRGPSRVARASPLLPCAQQ